MNIIDLRSDTVTKPDKEMMEAILTAKVGDDVYGEDPTVNELQEFTAELLGKEAALFVPSGTMGNQLGLKINTNEGDEVICENEAHIFFYETAAPSLISRIQLKPIISESGEVPIEKIEAAIRPNIYYFPTTSLICIENTHNRHGGSVISMNYLNELYNLAQEHGLKLHLDGARLWNASAATGISMKEYSKNFNTVNVCLSKGLGAPIGSLIVGTRKDIDKALKWRKILGGGMRQAGFLAAAGLYAIKNNYLKLIEDHRKAKDLAKLLNLNQYCKANLDSIHTNIVIFECLPPLCAESLVKKLTTKGVLLHWIGGNKIRAVLHLQIRDYEIQNAVEIINTTIGQML